MCHIGHGPFDIINNCDFYGDTSRGQSAYQSVCAKLEVSSFTQDMARVQKCQT